MLEGGREGGCWDGREGERKIGRAGGRASQAKVKKKKKYFVVLAERNVEKIRNQVTT